MVKKLTLGFKKDNCRYCKEADNRAMRQGRPFCASSYKPRNGHCENIKPNKAKLKGGNNHDTNRKM